MTVIQPTCDFTGCLAQVDGREVGALPEVIELLGEAVGDAQPLQLFRRAIAQPTQQGREALPWLQGLTSQITCKGCDPFPAMVQ